MQGLERQTGAFIEQEQNLNCGKAKWFQIYTWSKVSRTGEFYMGSRDAADAIKYSVDTSNLKDSTVK